MIALVARSASAQTDEQTRKLQIAQSLEQAGDWKQAAVLYEDLWRSDTTNYVYFDALRMAYSQMKEYDKALGLISHRMRMRPAEFYLAAYLGGTWFDAGQHQRADSVWEALLQVQPRQRQMYVLVAQQMQERRLFGRAIDTYLKGRAATGNDAEFAQELALLHSAMQTYGEAVREYLRILEQTPHQLGYVQSRIASFTIRDEGLRQAAEVVAEAVKRQPARTQFRALQAWLLMEQGRYADALPVYRTIDSLSGTNGAQVFSFAQSAARAGQFAVAIEAYGDIVAITPPSQLRPQAMYGMAQAYEQTLPDRSGGVSVLVHQDPYVPESMQASDSAQVLYQRVIQEYPGSQPALEALFRIGVIRYERLFDLDGALRAFDEIRADRRAGNLAWEALLMSTTVRVARGDVEGARAMLTTAPQQARGYLQDRFTLQYARLSYLLGQYELSLGMLRGVTESLSRDAANDALTLFYHIQEGSSDSSSLALFAKAELLQQERKYAEALGLYKEVSVVARTAMLGSRSRIAVAEMLTTLGRPGEAVVLLDSVVRTYPSDVLRDRALYLMGVLYEERLGDRQQASDAYEKFLALFPTSVFADNVRQRVRSLRKDAL